MPFSFQPVYHSLSDFFYQPCQVDLGPNPEVVLFRKQLAEQLQLGWETKTQVMQTLSEQLATNNPMPISLAYSGHQFGHFAILGDGRACLIGSLTNNNRIVDFQLKGSGPTTFSRGGDGRGTFSSMLREYLISYAMEKLGIATSQSLFVIQTGQPIVRQEREKGGILCRLAQSHIRIGSFSYAAYRGGEEKVIELADFVIQHYYPHLQGQENRFLDLLQEFTKHYRQLICQWMNVGFIHGVMNTDNVSIVNETIDYGPCAFMDIYANDRVFSSIDKNGRYAYDQQPLIGAWNLARLCECFIPLLAKTEADGLMLANQLVASFQEQIKQDIHQMYIRKIGFDTYHEKASRLVQQLLDGMEKYELDYTNTFIYLIDQLHPQGIDPSINLLPPDFSDPWLEEWVDTWKDLLKAHYGSFTQPLATMKQANPVLVPKNHWVEEALTAARRGDMAPFEKLFDALSYPYSLSTIDPSYLDYRPFSSDYQTYCGT